LVEDIITTLSKLAGLRVIARNSSFVYKGRSVDVREAAKQLGVRYVLEGSVRRSGNRIRITAQFFAYADNYLIDLKAAVIVDVEATRAIRQAEVGAARTMIERTISRHGTFKGATSTSIGRQRKTLCQRD
jgi:hypothetical protein